MKKALIFTSFVQNLSRIHIDSNEFDLVICADGGLEIAKKLGISPDIPIGDYDSMQLPQNQKIIKLPMEKNMTDSEAAIDFAISDGFNDITVIGGNLTDRKSVV